MKAVRNLNMELSRCKQGESWISKTAFTWCAFLCLIGERQDRKGKRTGQENSIDECEITKGANN